MPKVAMPEMPGMPKVAMPVKGFAPTIAQAKQSGGGGGGGGGGGDATARAGAGPGPVIAGAKDSGGQWSNTAAMIERFSHRGFSVFAGSENFLMRTLRAGGAGCISATANVNPAAISSLCSNWTATDADAQQHRLDVVRALFAAFPMIPAMKAAVAQVTGESDWKRVRPPLVSLDATQELALLNSMKEAGFEMKN
jgi:4-hydroxy-tetrahydrodipicolinate synthase